MLPNGPAERITPEWDRPLAALVEAGDLTAARQWLTDHPSHVVADEMARMGQVGAVVAFRLLEKDRALEVFEELEPVDQQSILEGLRGADFLELVQGMDPDDRASMLGEAPAKVVRRVLGGLTPREHRMTAALLGYPDGSVGRVMSPEVVVLRDDLTVSEALQRVRRVGGQAETVYTLPVVESGRRLTGVVQLRELVLSDPDLPVGALVTGDPVTVQATASAEQAARLMQETNELNLPVVDSEGRLLGLFTYDDADEVIEAADTEDTARQAASAPWAGHYMAASVVRLAGYRALWLSLLLVAAVMTVSVTQAFEATLAQVTALALFIPMIIGAGGNAGAQAASACVRAIAVGQVRGSDLVGVIWRECRVGLLLGLLLAILGVGIAAVFVDVQVALVVGITLVLICGWAATIGGAMPLLARRVGIDPAVVSAPLVTTLVDALGLVIYFVTATLVLGL